MPKKKIGNAGFSLLELGVVVVVFGIMAGVLLNRVLSYQAEAERTSVEQTVAILRTALHLRIANLVANDKGNEIVKLAEQNPMDWLVDKPKNYLGVFYSPKTTNIATGNWYFDKNSRNLVYLLNHGTNFRDGERKQLNFKAKLVNNDNNSLRKTAPQGANETQGVVLVELNR